jgi:hypothetical protein
LFRAAKGAVERLPTGKIEDVAKEAVREVGRAFESLGTELEKVVGRAAGGATPPPAGGEAPEDTTATATTANAEPKTVEAVQESAAPSEPPKGPRIV